MNERTSENKKLTEDSFLESLLNNRCAGTISTGESFGGILLSFDSESLIVTGRRGARTLIKRDAITSIYEVG